MGKRQSDKKTWTEEDIQDVLRRNFMSESNVKFVAENLYIYEWESDIWFMTKANYMYEIEIKVSKADFKNDFKNKTLKHQILTEDMKNRNGEPYLKPNYFYYAVPDGLIEESDVPEYAGLIYMKDYFPYFDIVKQAPKISSVKHNEEDLNLLEKFYYNYRQWKIKARTERMVAEELNRMIDNYNEKPEDEKKHYTKLLEENTKYKLVMQTETDKADRYYKFWQENQKELACQRFILRELMGLLKDNNIPFNIGKLEDEYYDTFGNV